MFGSFFVFLNCPYKTGVTMKKYFYKLLNTINKAILPKYSKQDPSTLSKIQLAVVAYRYYVLVNSLD